MDGGRGRERGRGPGCKRRLEQEWRMGLLSVIVLHGSSHGICKAGIEGGEYAGRGGQNRQRLQAAAGGNEVCVWMCVFRSMCVDVCV